MQTPNDRKGLPHWPLNHRPVWGHMKWYKEPWFVRHRWLLVFGSTVSVTLASLGTILYWIAYRV